MYETVDVVIRDGRIIPVEPEDLPKRGKALLVVTEEEHRPREEKVRDLLGWLKTDLDAAEWQRKVRNPHNGEG